MSAASAIASLSCPMGKHLVNIGLCAALGQCDLRLHMFSVACMHLAEGR